MSHLRSQVLGVVVQKIKKGSRVGSESQEHQVRAVGPGTRSSVLCDAGKLTNSLSCAAGGCKHNTKHFKVVQVSSKVFSIWLEHIYSFSALCHLCPHFLEYLKRYFEYYRCYPLHTQRELIREPLS